MARLRGRFAVWLGASECKLPRTVFWEESRLAPVNGTARHSAGRAVCRSDGEGGQEFESISR